MKLLQPTVAAGALRNLLRCQEQYGQASWVANHFGVSRSTLYRMKECFLETVCQGPGRPRKSANDREIERLQAQNVELQQQSASWKTQCQEQVARFRRAQKRTAFCLIALGFPARELASLQRQCFGIPANRTGILEQTRQYASRATEIMEQYFWPAARDVDLDEIFIENLPLLIASDPRSLAILKTSKEDELTVERWSAFLQDLPQLERVSSDRGWAILGAVAQREGCVRQSDLFHFKMLLSDTLRPMEDHAYALLAAEELAQKARKKRGAKGRDCRGAAARLRCAAQKTDEAIALFDQLEPAVKLAFEALRLTTPEGTFNSPARARDLLHFVKDWIDAHLPQGWRAVKNALQDNLLLTFLEEMHQALPGVPVQCHCAADRQFVLVTLARLWEEQSPRRYRGKPVLIPHAIHEQLRTRCSNLPEVQAQLFPLLEKLHRASSGVECINSRIGFYRYSKHRFSSDFANLIAVWHNLTPFHEGKRAGQSPAQLLGVPLPTHDIFELFAVA